MPLSFPARTGELKYFSCLLLSLAALGLSVKAASDLEFPALGGPETAAETQAGFTDFYQGNLDASLKHFNAAIAANPQDALALYGAAQLVTGNGDMQRGFELFCAAAVAGRTSPWEELFVDRMAHALRFCTDPQTFLAFVQAALKDPTTPAHVQDMLQRRYARWLEGRGDYAGAREAFKPLNFVTRWALCGPFDNRDNSGFKTAYEPETEIDFEKSVQGRNRQVKWFRPDADPEDGKIELTDLFEPHIHTIAYAVTFVKADAAHWAVIRCGAAGALALWVNGKPAGTIENHNDWGNEKLAAPVALHKGWNKILLKSAVVEDTAWAFSLRICAPQDGPDTGLQIDPSADALKEFNAQKLADDAAPAKPATFELGLSARLADFLATEKNNVPALAAAAYLDHLNLRDKKDNQGASRRLLHAIELAPKSPHLRLQAARSSGDSNEARQAAEAALASHPDLPAALEALANLAERSHSHLIAEDYARRACALVGDKNCSLAALTLADALVERSDGAASGRGNREGGSDRRAEAFKLVKKFTDLHPYDADAWQRLIGLEISGSARRTLLDKALQFCGGDDQLRQMYGDELTALGKERQAAEYLASVERTHPYSISDVLAASGQFRRAGDLAQAAKVLKDALAWAPENPDLLAALGLTEHYAGKTAEAKQLFQQALQLKPNSPHIKDYLAELNEGQSTDKQFFAPYDIALKDLKAPSAEDFPNDNSVNILDQEVVKLNANYSASRMVHLISKVLRPQGIAEVYQHRVFYDPQRQVVDVLRAVVITPDGRELSRADISDLSTSAAAGVETLIYDESHLKQITFPDLEPGSIVDLQYTLRDTGENMFGDFFTDRHELNGYTPAIKRQYVIDYPKSVNVQSRTFKAKVEPEHLESKDPQREIMKWEHDNTPGLLREADMPPAIDELAQLQITTMGSWEEVGKWYWHLAQDQLTVSEELKSEIAKITKDCKTDTDKVRAVQQFVIHQIRYLGIEFGRNGYKPHAASESYKARYGDCKDKATLITAMLKELGIASRLVLICTTDAGAVPKDSLPMPNTYNHCIAYLPNVDGKDFWIDGTADFYQLGEVPWADRSAQVLVSEPNGGKFLQIPLNKPDENLFEQKFNVAVGADGSATVAMRTARSGQWAPRYRALIETPGKYEREVQDYAAKRFNGAEVTKWKASKSDEPGPAWLEADIKVPSMTSQSGDRKALPASLEPMALAQRYTTESKRSYDLELHFPWRRHTELTYTLAAPMTVVSLPKDSTLDEPFGKFSRKITQEGAVVRIVEDFELSVRRLKVAEYDAFKAFCNRVDALIDEKILIDAK